MAGKNPKIETSGSEQERLLVKTEIKKKLECIRQRPTRKYGKNWESNAKVIPDPLYKEMANCLDALEKLETVPKRFRDLADYLRTNKTLNLSPEDFDTVLLALSLAEKHQSLRDEILKLHLKIISPMAIYFSTKEKKGHEAGLREAALELGWVEPEKGKKGFWTKTRLDTLKGIYENLLKKYSKRKAVEIIFKKYQKRDPGRFSFPNQLSITLRKAGLEKVPDMNYVSKRKP